MSTEAEIPQTSEITVDGNPDSNKMNGSSSSRNRRRRRRNNKNKNQNQTNQSNKTKNPNQQTKLSSNIKGKKKKNPWQKTNNSSTLENIMNDQRSKQNYNYNEAMMDEDVLLEQQMILQAI